MTVYTYWVNQAGTPMPEYIRLCLQTWAQAMPENDVTIINHDNVEDFLPPEMLTPSLYGLSLAMQSDVVSAWVLMTSGGIFLDADTIMLSNPFAQPAFQQDKLIAFGYPQHKTIHLAVLANRLPQNPLLAAWVDNIKIRLQASLPAEPGWDFVGNSIVNPLLQLPVYQHDCHIIDASGSGNILEAATDQRDAYQRYLNYYFSPPTESFATLRAQARYGIVSLHNSWTPAAYRQASREFIAASRDRFRLSWLLASLCL